MNALDDTSAKSDDSTGDGDTTAAGRGFDGRRIGRWLIASPLVGLVVVLIYASSKHLEAGSTFWSVLGLGSAATFAALISGVLVGFLFGLPRTLERQNTKSLLATNTNLDQISDWLTKILVGLGLVQLGKVTHGVQGMASSLAPGLGGGTGAQAVATSVLVYSAVDGFLIGYLWCRLVLSRRFRDAARELLEEQLAPIASTLEPKPDPPLPSPEALKAQADTVPLAPSGG